MLVKVVGNGNISKRISVVLVFLGFFFVGHKLSSFKTCLVVRERKQLTSSWPVLVRLTHWSLDSQNTPGDDRQKAKNFTIAIHSRHIVPVQRLSH